MSSGQRKRVGSWRATTPSSVVRRGQDAVPWAEPSEKRAKLREELGRLEKVLGDDAKLLSETRHELGAVLRYKARLIVNAPALPEESRQKELSSAVEAQKHLSEFVKELQVSMESTRSEIEAFKLQLEGNFLCSAPCYDSSAALAPTYIERVLSVGSPSEVEKVGLYSVQTQGDEPLYECGFPANAQPALPLTLAHSVFATFRDDLTDMTIVLDDSVCMFVADLCFDVLGRMQAFEDERALRQEFNRRLSNFLGFRVVAEEVHCGTRTATTDGTVLTNYQWWALLVDVKLEKGNTLAPGLQTFAIYTGSVNDQTQLLPCFYIEVMGPTIRIGGLVSFEKVSWQPLTAFMSCIYSDYDREDMLTLCRAMLALRKGLFTLESYYRDAHPAVTPKHIPYPLQGKQSVRIGKKPVFIVTLDNGERRIFKYCRRYGEEVHRSWAGEGLAPLLHGCKPIAGGWLEVQMQYLEGWGPAASLLDTMIEPERDKLKAAISAALDRALAILIDNYQVAHGDMRPPNIMVRRVHGDKFDVKFIDFDWAGKVGIVKYPPFINKELQWHPDVGAGKSLKQDHDKWWLTAL